MAFTMAYPNFKKGLKMVFGPLGVKVMIKTSKISIMNVSNLIFAFINE
jgi:hypothetical protein